MKKAITAIAFVINFVVMLIPVIAVAIAGLLVSTVWQVMDVLDLDDPW